MSDPNADTQVLVVRHPSSSEHIGPPNHPESPDRLTAVDEALSDPLISGSLCHVEAREASVSELSRVHTSHHIEQIRHNVEQGRRHIDPDTYASPGSWAASMTASGAGLTAVEHLDADQEFAGAFVAVRPPGHHATSDRAMGFCLFNNIAVTAASLADRGERVLVIDWDVHHGNGTQAIFWNDPRVSFVSLHEANNYPFSGRVEERGGNGAVGSTINLPLPSGATGDVYRAGFDRVIEAAAATLEPTWVLVSAGFDAHNRDPLSDMGLTSGDFGSMTKAAIGLAPSGARTILFLEGGYDLTGLKCSVRSSIAAMAGVEFDDEQVSSGGPGLDVVSEVATMP